MNSVSSCEYSKGYDNYLSFLQTKNSEKQTSSCELSQRKMSEGVHMNTMDIFESLILAQDERWRRA